MDTIAEGVDLGIHKLDYMGNVKPSWMPAGLSRNLQKKIVEDLRALGCQDGVIEMTQETTFPGNRPTERRIVDIFAPHQATEVLEIIQTEGERCGLSVSRGGSSEVQEYLVFTDCQGFQQSYICRYMSLSEYAKLKVQGNDDTGF